MSVSDSFKLDVTVIPIPGSLEVGIKRKAERSNDQDRVAKVARVDASSNSGSTTFDGRVATAEKASTTASSAKITESVTLPLVRGEITRYLPGRGGKRRYFSAAANTTVSRSNLIETPAALSMGVSFIINTENDPRKRTLEGLELRERVLHHAFTRVNLFYYMCVAYWKEGVEITRSTTCLQHGVGPYYGTSAAHSCILPSIRDTTFDCLNERVRTTGFTSYVDQRLLALGMPLERLNELKTKWESDESARSTLDLKAYFEAGVSDQLISPTSSFYQSMNSTVILPDYMNMFDTKIEAALRPCALQLLNRVSQEGLSPYKAAEEFVDHLHLFLDGKEKSLNSKIDGLNTIFQAEQVLLAVELEIKRCNSKDFHGSLAVLERYVEAVIYLRNNVRNFNRVKGSTGFPKEMKERHSHFRRAFDQVDEFVNLGRKKRKKMFTSGLISQSRLVCKKLRKLKKIIKERVAWPEDMAPMILKLERCRSVCQIQREGTALSSLEHLSGVKEMDGLRAMTESELTSQKFQIVKSLNVLDYDDSDFPKKSLFG